MTIYVDNLNLRASVKNGSKTHRSRWCHLMTDGSDQELIDFAKRIGLKPEWLQDAGTFTSHFDVTEPKRRAAVRAGATEISWRDLGALLECRRLGQPYQSPLFG